MIIRGRSRTGAASLSGHLLKMEKNERVDVLHVRGTMSENLIEAFEEMEALTVGTRCKNAFYHASMSPSHGERLTAAQWEQAADILAEKFGMEDHARAIVLHTKGGEQHAHVVFCRIDPDTMKAAHDGHNYARNEEAAREMERVFGLQRVQGVFAEREHGTPRPERTPALWEMQQGRNSKIDPRAFWEQVREIRTHCDTGQAFAAALEENGIALCQGDRRDFVLLDERGGVHSLSRTLGMKAAEVRDYMQGIERDKLPTVDQGRAMIHERGDRLEIKQELPQVAPQIVDRFMPEKPPEREQTRDDRNSGVDMAINQGLGGAVKAVESVVSALENLFVPDYSQPQQKSETPKPEILPPESSKKINMFGYEIDADELEAARRAFDERQRDRGRER